MNSYFWFSCISSDHDSAEGFDLDSTLKTVFSSSQTLKHNMLERGVRYLTGENLKVVWGRVFNFKLASFASYQH